MLLWVGLELKIKNGDLDFLTSNASTLTLLPRNSVSTCIHEFHVTSSPWQQGVANKINLKT